MNIKRITDRIYKEADVNRREYVMEDVIDDVNQEYLFLIEKARQIGPSVPMGDGAAVTQTMTNVTKGETQFSRNIANVGIVKVEYRYVNNEEWQCMDKDDLCATCRKCEVATFRAYERDIYITSNVDSIDVRITYDRPLIQKFTVADVSLTTPPEPLFLPEEFHPLLWMKPALTQTGYFKTERYPVLQARYEELFEQFSQHYRRGAQYEAYVETNECHDTPNL